VCGDVLTPRAAVVMPGGGSSCECGEGVRVYLTCALLSSGGEACWREVANGRLGRGSSSITHVPGLAATPLSGRNVDVQAGLGHARVLLEGGQVAC
jgi:hypothetical protein